MSFIDKIGQRYGRLVVVERSFERGANAVWICLCDCGKQTKVKSNSLKSSHTQSCGCLAKENRKKANTTHGKHGTPIYVVWKNMKVRCYNENGRDYHNYGGRGIIVCDQWKESFENFLADMGEIPSLKHTIDRIDNDGNYEPSNCRWATRSEQATNRRTKRLITVDGVCKTMTEFANDYGIQSHVILKRLNRGWNESDAVTKARQKRYLITSCDK